MERKITKRRRMKRLLILAAIIVAVLSLIVLYRNVNPVGTESSKYMPKCVIKTLTGYDCPSCGSQRALHAMLNGEVKEAILLNPFIFLLLPYLVLLLLTTISKSRLALKIRPYVQNRKVAYIYIGFYFTWWIVRNMRWWVALCESLQ